MGSTERTVQGISGVLEAYRFAIANTELCGPTNFEPTIRAFLEKCKQFPRDGSKFQVKWNFKILFLNKLILFLFNFLFYNFLKFN
jgi:hypothetical protein